MLEARGKHYAKTQVIRPDTPAWYVSDSLVRDGLLKLSPTPDGDPYVWAPKLSMFGVESLKKRALCSDMIAVINDGYVHNINVYDNIFMIRDGREEMRTCTTKLAVPS